MPQQISFAPLPVVLPVAVEAEVFETLSVVAASLDVAELAGYPLFHSLLPASSVYAADTCHTALV